MPARTGFKSMYNAIVRKASPSCTSTLLNFSIHKVPRRSRRLFSHLLNRCLTSLVQTLTSQNRRRNDPSTFSASSIRPFARKSSTPLRRHCT